MVNKLFKLLSQVKSVTGDDFSGLGLIICDTPEFLPIVPIRPVSSPPSKFNLIDSLVSISTLDSEYHDGFHILSSDWTLSRISQYFLPPIVNGVIVDRSKTFGGRYIAALFGSAIPNVRLSGIASKGFGIAIFKDGAETYFQDAL